MQILTSKRLLGMIALFVSSSIWGDTTLKFATVSPANSLWMREFSQGAEKVKEATEGRVRFKFYPSGVMGDDTSVMRKMRARQLHGAVVLTGVFNRRGSNVQVYNLPMQFRSLEEVDLVRAAMDPFLANELEKAGFISLGFAEVGFAYAMGTRPATSLAQARDLKIWVNKGDVAAAQLMDVFGIKPIPLTLVDVLSGLQTGLIDTVTSPPLGAVALQWHTRIRYILDIPFVYVYSLVILDNRALSNVNEADQRQVTEIMRSVITQAERLNRSDHNATFNVLLNQGVQLLRPSEKALAEWRNVAETTGTKWVETGVLSKEIYDRFRSELDAARSTLAQ